MEYDSEIERVLTNARHNLPRLWWNIYQGALNVGFDETQAFSLVQTQILSQCPHGVRPNDLSGPDTDDLEDDSDKDEKN